MIERVSLRNDGRLSREYLHTSIHMYVSVPNWYSESTSLLVHTRNKYSVPNSFVRIYQFQNNSTGNHNFKVSAHNVVRGILYGPQAARRSPRIHKPSKVQS